MVFSCCFFCGLSMEIIFIFAALFADIVFFNESRIKISGNAKK